MKLLLTGGRGFIGSAMVRRAVAAGRHETFTVDKMTYTASEEALGPARYGPRHLQAALDWQAAHDFERGLAATIDWYLDNRAWWEGIRAQTYQGQRLGMTA